MVTVVAMLFLVGAVMFAMAQVHRLLSNSVADGQANADSNAAFFMAESGLERARAQVETLLNSGTFTNTSCTGVTTSSPYPLPPAPATARGTVSISTTSTPANCTIGGATPCTGCSVTATGTVGQAVRTVQQTIVLSTAQGVTCNGATSDCSNCASYQGNNCQAARNPPQWKLKLKNPSTTLGAMGVFVLAYDQQGNNTAACAAGSNCSLQLTVPSPSNGNNSAGLQGNSVQIPAGTSWDIYQFFGKSPGSCPGGNNCMSLAQVGALFQGTSTPLPAGPSPSTSGSSSYWNNGGAPGTTGAGNNYSGAVNDGTLTTTANCLAPSTNNNSAQTCTSWCSGGDTIVLSVARSSTAVADQLDTVTFGTNATNGQNLPMSPIARYPGSGVSGASANLGAEIWSLQNENFPGSTISVSGLSSFKGVGTGSVGARWNGTNSGTSLSATEFTVASDFSSSGANEVISEGDTISFTGGNQAPTCPSGICGTVGTQKTPLLTGERLGGRGRYNVSGVTVVPGASNRVWTVSSSRLRVSGCTICAIAATGDSWGTATNATLGTLTRVTPNDSGFGLTESDGGIGRYDISTGTKTYLPSGTAIYVGSATTFAGTPGTTVYVPTANATPLEASTTRIVSVKAATTTSAISTLKPGTKIATTAAAAAAPSVNTSSFTLNQAPNASLVNATVCAGTCALFTQQTSAGSSTTFSFQPSTPTSNLREWAAGFTCLKNVTQVLAVTSSTAASTRWLEVTK